MKMATSKVRTSRSNTAGRVTVIATPGNLTGTIAAKAATTAIPIVFAVAEDPVKFGLVASLARPEGNLTGINFFNAEITAKRLGLLRELVRMSQTSPIRPTLWLPGRN